MTRPKMGIHSHAYTSKAASRRHCVREGGRGVVMVVVIAMVTVMVMLLVTVIVAVVSSDFVTRDGWGQS